MAVSNILNFLNIGGVSPTGTSAQGENPRPKAQDGEVSSLPSDVDPRGLERLASKEKTITGGDLPFPLAEASLTTEGDPPTDPIAEARALIRRKRDLRNDKIENERRIAGLEDDIEDLNEEIGETEELAKKQELRGQRREKRSQIRDREADNAQIDSEIEAIDDELAILTSPPPAADEDTPPPDEAGGGGASEDEAVDPDDEEDWDLDDDGLPDSVDNDRDNDSVLNADDPDPDDPDVTGAPEIDPAMVDPTAPIRDGDLSFQVIRLHGDDFRSPSRVLVHPPIQADFGRTLRLITTNVGEEIKVINRTGYIEVIVTRTSDGKQQRFQILPDRSQEGHFGRIQIDGNDGINILKFEGFAYSTLHQVPDDYDVDFDPPPELQPGEKVLFMWARVEDLWSNNRVTYPAPTTQGYNTETRFVEDSVLSRDEGTNTYHITSTTPYTLKIPDQIQLRNGTWQPVVSIQGIMDGDKRVYILRGARGELARVVEDNSVPGILVLPPDRNMYVDLSRFAPVSFSLEAAAKEALLKLIGANYNMRNFEMLTEQDRQAIIGWTENPSGVGIVGYYGQGSLNVKLTAGNDLFMKGGGSFYANLGDGDDVAIGRGDFRRDIQMYEGKSGADYLSGRGKSLFKGGDGADTIVHEDPNGEAFILSEDGSSTNSYRVSGTIKFSNDEDGGRQADDDLARRSQAMNSESSNSAFSQIWENNIRAVNNRIAGLDRPEDEEGGEV